jgi:hypothetical protein
MPTDTEGVTVAARIDDVQVWREFKAIAVRKGVRIGDLLEAVLKSYVAHEKGS